MLYMYIYNIPKLYQLNLLYHALYQTQINYSYIFYSKALKRYFL
jgi:hypothetical protein